MIISVRRIWKNVNTQDRRETQLIGKAHRSARALERLYHRNRGNVPGGTLGELADVAAPGLEIPGLGSRVYVESLGAPVTVAMIFLLLYNSVALSVRWRGLGHGYRWGREIPSHLGKIGWKRWTKRLRRAALGLSACLLLPFFISMPLGTLAVVAAAAACMKLRMRGVSNAWLLAGLIGAAALVDLGGGL